MSKYKYSESEQEINKVLKYHDDELNKLKDKTKVDVDDNIKESEELLKSLGKDVVIENSVQESCQKKVMIVPTWEELRKKAICYTPEESELESLFTSEELKDNSEMVKMINEDFKQIYRLDSIDYLISAAGGIVGAAINILLVGAPVKTHDGLRGKPLSEFVRNKFNEKIPPGMNENKEFVKTPYDAQDNRNTKIDVKGLSSYYHRLYSLGHDPLLGFVFGVLDIYDGKMSTIDKYGKFARQKVEGYESRVEKDIFKAIAKQFCHLSSDVTTEMGLPVPLMNLFSLLQIGEFGDQDQTIAEIVQGMYYEGYDFIHFCSMSIPTMITEVVVRLGYALKRLKETRSVKDSIPFSLKRNKNPKLATMLFIAHTSSAGINCGQVVFTKNPMQISYPEWMAFAKYSYIQLKWVLIQKPQLQDEYFEGKLAEEWEEILEKSNQNFDSFSKDYIVVFNN